MAGASEERTLEETPTWAVAAVCFLLVLVSIIIEHSIHLIGKWLTKKHKRALYEALEKIKSELMLLGFISLLLTVGQGTISNICITESVGSTWHPCTAKQENRSIQYDHYKESLHNNNNNNDHQNHHIVFDENNNIGNRRLLLSTTVVLSDSNLASQTLRRVLASKSDQHKCAQGKVPIISVYGIHQLHIFIFILAVSHVLYCIITLALGRTKMRKWKSWEMETRTINYQFSNDPERFRFARDTSFGRRHLNFWSHYSLLLWIVCFVRQFVRSVPKVDYLTLRNGFIIAHLAPHSQTRFDFQKYIKRSLEEDFKVVVGISPIIWFFAILFLLSNTNGLRSYLWLPFIPLIIILLIGTKLQVIITKMGLQIQERGEVVKGTPLVQPGDQLFWFGRPRLILFLIHFVLFQNAFQLAFLAWTLIEFGLKSCFHNKLEDVIIRISMWVLIQILCSYVTLPLYALVTQMGSTMKATIFNDRIANGLREWHQTARKRVRQRRPVAGRGGGSAPGTPSRPTSPVHLLERYKSQLDSGLMSPRSPVPGSPIRDQKRKQPQQSESGVDVGEPSSVGNSSIEIDIPMTEFSFDKSERI